MPAMPSARRPVVTAMLLVLAATPVAGCSGGAPTRAHGATTATPSGPASAGSASAGPSAVAHLAAQPAPSTSSSAPAAGATGDCPIFPADNVWHADVSRLPVLGNSAALVGSIGTGAAVHADFGSGTWDGGPIGIPVTTVPAGQPAVPVTFQYRSESDP